MLAAPGPDPGSVVDPELVEAVVGAQGALRRFLSTRAAPVYLRQGVAPLMGLRVPTLASVPADESGRA